MLSELLPSILAMVFCVIMSAYFSATETAFSSLNKTRLKALSEKGNKKADLIPMKELLPTTGYIRGGCTPIGMKKPFPTFIHSTALDFERIYISAGVRGLQIAIHPQALIDFVGATVAELIQ